jgi:hypothetical protein
MAVFTGKTYTGATINLDGDSYRDCLFLECVLVYGGETPIGETLKTKGCTFELTGAAGNTLNFLHANYLPFCENCKDKGAL